jgi:hypothetical protein
MDSWLLELFGEGVSESQSMLCISFSGGVFTLSSKQENIFKSPILLLISDFDLSLSQSEKKAN